MARTVTPPSLTVRAVLGASGRVRAQMTSAVAEGVPIPVPAEAVPRNAHQSRYEAYVIRLVSTASTSFLMDCFGLLAFSGTVCSLGIKGVALACLQYHAHVHRRAAAAAGMLSDDPNLFEAQPLEVSAPVARTRALRARLTMALNCAGLPVVALGGVSLRGPRLPVGVHCVQPGRPMPDQHPKTVACDTNAAPPPLRRSCPCASWAASLGAACRRPRASRPVPRRRPRRRPRRCPLAGACILPRRRHRNGPRPPRRQGPRPRTTSTSSTSCSTTRAKPRPCIGGCCRSESALC